MILKRSDWDYLIPISINQPNFIIIPDVNLFFRYERELIAQSMGNIGEFSIKEYDKDINLETEVDLIIHPYTLSLNSRKTIAHLHKRIIKETAVLEFPKKVDDIHKKLMDLLEEIRAKTLVNFVFENDIGLEDILKWYNVRFAENEDDPINLIIKYMDIIKDIMKLKIVILFHACSYFTDIQIFNLYKHFQYQNLSVIFFERFKPEFSTMNLNAFTIDMHMCYNLNEEN
jgi:CRISPR type II-A-associated protein Csn2